MHTNRQVNAPVRNAGPARSAKPAALRARTLSGVLAALAIAGLAVGCGTASSGGTAAWTAPAGSTGSAGLRAAGSASAAPSAVTSASAAGCAGGGATGASAPALQAIQFVGQDHGWAAGAGRIVATSDGGRTWSRQYSGPAVLDQVDFTDTAHGWAVGPGTVLRTTNGGTTWTALREPRLSGHCLTVSSVHFVSAGLGYAIAGATPAGGAAVGGSGTPEAGGQVVRTTDGGVTWSPVSGAPAGAQAVCFGTARDGYAGADGRIWRTTDGGATWTLSFTEPPASAGQGSASQSAGDAPELGCAGSGAAWALFLGTGAAMMHAPYLAYATQDGSSWHGVLEEPMTESAIRPGLHLPAGPGTEPGPFSVISPDAAAFTGYTPPANGWGAAPLDLATDGGATLTSAGNIAAINEPLGTAFVTPARGWVVGENLKTQTFAIEATANAGHTWTTEYTTG